MIIQEGKIIPNQKVKNTKRIINDNDKNYGKGKNMSNIVRYLDKQRIKKCNINKSNYTGKEPA